MFLRNDTLVEEEKLLFRGIQKTMIVQLVGHCTMVVIPVIGLISSVVLRVPYLLPFMIMIECGPTVTTVLTIISVPEYRGKLKMCFNKISGVRFDSE